MLHVGRLACLRTLLRETGAEPTTQVSLLRDGAAVAAAVAIQADGVPLGGGRGSGGGQRGSPECHDRRVAAER